MVPNSVHQTHGSTAEERIFRLIRDAPRTEDWVCLHSLGIAEHAYKRRAEIDFLLITPEGVFVLEVKGGRIRRENGDWFYVNRHGQAHRSQEGPIKQAESAMFALEKSIRKNFPDRKRIKNVFLGFAVMFPDIEFDGTGTELAESQVFDVRSKRLPFRSFVDRLARFTRETQPGLRNGLRAPEVRDLVDFLQGDFDLIPKFSITAADTNAELARLTHEQYRVLKADEHEERLLVYGAAGTGKTLLALEVARREARQGRSVLLLCFNQALAANLEVSLSNVDGVRCSSYARYLAEVTRGSSVEKEVDEAKRKLHPSDYYSRALPEYASYALIESEQKQVDVLVVDEAQDILTPVHLEALSHSLKDGLEQGRWRFFMDRNTQAAIYGNLDEEAHRKVRQLALTMTLSVNCRNTSEVATATKLVAAPRSSAPSRLSGRPVERKFYSTERELKRALSECLTALERDGATPSQVTVLLPRKPTPERTQMLKDLGLVPYAPREPTPTRVRYAVVSGFKGLENDAIIFAGVDELESEWGRAVAYVAMSRARVRLCLILSEHLKSLLLQRFQEQLMEQVANEVS